MRIQGLERAMTRDRATKEAEEKDRVEMRQRLDIWDDDESDELFYVDRFVYSPLLAFCISPPPKCTMASHQSPKSGVRGGS